MNMSALLLPLLSAQATTTQAIQDKLPNELVTPQSQKALYSGRYYREDSFGVRDIIRVGSMGFKAIRSLNHPYNGDATFPSHEIHGWKMVHSEITTKDNEALYVTSHVPNRLFSHKRKVKVTAHFIVSKNDAPQKGEKKSVKLGFWVGLSNYNQSPRSDDTFYVESEEIVVPDQSTFGSSNVTRFKVSVEFDLKAQSEDLLYLLTKRVSLSDDQKEYKHPQGVALNSLTIGYQI